MALTMKKKESTSSRWYRKNKQRLSEKRKKEYRENPEYRQRQLEASKRYRRGERSLPNPPGAPISIAEAAKRIGIGITTLHEWRNKKLFPEPKRHHKRTLWFTEKQVLLLKSLKEFFRLNGRKPHKIKHAQLKAVKAYIFSNWE